MKRAITRWLLSPDSFLSYSSRRNSIAEFTLARPISALPSFPMFTGPSSDAQFDWTPPLRVPSLTDVIDFGESMSEHRGDGQHFLVLAKIHDFEFDTEEDLFNCYIKMLATAVGSEYEAKKRMYLVCCGWLYGFGAKLDKKACSKLEEISMCYVYEDKGFNVRNKDSFVQSAIRFMPVNPNNRLDNIFSYHYQSPKILGSKWNHDHWLVNIKRPDGNKKEISDYCIKMLAEVVGSEEEAQKKIYVIWFKSPFGFGAEINEETSNKLKGRLDVLNVIPDYEFNIKDETRGVSFVVSSSYGLRLSRYLPTEDMSGDWSVCMDEYVGESSEIYPLLRGDPYVNLYPAECGSDCKKWFIIMEKHVGDFASFQQKVACGLQTLASVAGREEAVRRKIHRIHCGRKSIVFGIKLDEETSNKLKGHPSITAVVEDYSDNARHKDVGGVSFGSQLSSVVSAQSAPRLDQIKWNSPLKDLFSYHHLSECNSEWKSDHWLIHIKQPDDKFRTEQQIIGFCINMLAEVLGSEVEARGKVYIVWCEIPFGFGAAIDEEISNKLKGRPDVLTVLPDYAFDIENEELGVVAISPSYWVGPQWQYMSRSPLDVIGLYSDSDSDCEESSDDES